MYNKETTNRTKAEMETIAILLVIILFYALLAVSWIWYKLDVDPKEGVYEVVRKEDGMWYVKQKHWSGRYHYVEENDDFYPPYKSRPVCFKTEDEAWRYVHEKIRI